MADSEHGTLVASTVATVTLTGNSGRSILVTNRSGGNPIYFTTDGTAPTVAGNDTLVVPAVAGAAKGITLRGSASTAVKLISAGAEDYSVEAD